MEPYNVVIAPSVMVTIEEVYSYVRDELGMPRAAAGLVGDLSNAIESLSHLPSRFSLVDVEPFRTAGVRRMNVRKYSIFYVVSEPRKEVGVFYLVYGTPSDERLARAFSS